MARQINKQEKGEDERDKIDEGEDEGGNWETIVSQHLDRTELNELSE